MREEEVVVITAGDSRTVGVTEDTGFVGREAGSKGVEVGSKGVEVGGIGVE